MPLTGVPGCIVIDYRLCLISPSKILSFSVRFFQHKLFVCNCNTVPRVLEPNSLLCYFSYKGSLLQMKKPEVTKSCNKVKSYYWDKTRRLYCIYMHAKIHSLVFRN